MELSGESKLLRIFVGEIDKVNHQPLYEAIVFKAKEKGLAGATVLRGIMSYGANSMVHTSKLVALSEDLPIVIEIVDKEEKIDVFIKEVQTLFETSGCGGMITSEKVNVISYQSTNK